MLYTSDIEVCIRVTFKCVCELRAHRAHLISHTHSIIFRYYSACYYALSAYLWQAYASCAHLHPHKRLRNVLSDASVVISREMTSVRAWRWRASELGDGERQSWVMTSVRAGRWRASELGDDGSDEAEMTSVTKQRWRVRGSGGYKQAWAEMTKGTKRRWRVWGSSGYEQAWAEMTKESLVRWCRVMRKVYEWDPFGCMGEVPLGVWVRCRWVYGWDAFGCMGETPTPVWVRYLNSCGLEDGVQQNWLVLTPNRLHV